MQSPGFNPAREAVLEAPPEVVRTGAVSEPSAVVRIVSESPETLVFEVDSSGPGYLVLADAWYPGWEATVDGGPAPILHADLLLRAVSLAGGHQLVTFSFHPRSLRMGLGLSLAGLIGLAVCWTAVGCCTKPGTML
jgi:uncharacterized membrane protein YfhO